MGRAAPSETMFAISALAVLRSPKRLSRSLVAHAFALASGNGIDSQTYARRLIQLRM